MPRGGGVALVSQSGAIAEEVIASSHSLGIPLGAVVSVGNAMHLGLTEYVEQLGADPACRAILLYAESFGDAERFRDVARRVTSRKPVIALVGGRTQPGRGSGVSPHRFDGLDRRGGGSVLPRLRHGARHEPAPADAGGQGIRRTSRRHRPARAGVCPTPAVRACWRPISARSRVCACRSCLPALDKRLRGFLPPEAAVANPLDLLADAREDRFGDTLAAALEDGAERSTRSS